MARRKLKPHITRVLASIGAEQLTFGRALASARRCEELTQSDCAHVLGISKAHLCDVEKGRKTVSPERAAKWARALGYPESVFVCLSLQAALDAAGLKYRVEIKAA